VQRRFAELHVIGRDDGADAFAFGDNKKIAFLRPVAAAGLIFLCRSEPPPCQGLKLKDPKDFRYLGKGEIGIVDLRDITTGAARYGADVRLPGMKYAVIARPPVTGGKVASFDGAAAMKVSGVEKVMEVKGWPWPSKFQL
jgi:hypothetical protein